MTGWFIAAASPFSTWEEFEGAIDGPTGGAIYTFADRPALIGVMIFVAALVFIYFLYSAFNIKNGHSTAKSPQVLAVLMLVGAASAMTSLYENVRGNDTRRASDRYEVAQSTQSSRSKPAALLGMAGIAGMSKRKRIQKARSRRRRR